MTQSPAILGDYRADFKAIKESPRPGETTVAHRVGGPGVVQFLPIGISYRPARQRKVEVHQRRPYSQNRFHPRPSS